MSDALADPDPVSIGYGMLADWDGYKMVGNGDERIELDGREFCLALVSRSGLTFTVEHCLPNASAIHLFPLPVDRVIQVIQ